MPRLITRLSGRRAVLQLVPVLGAKRMWAGELRSDHDLPAGGHIQVAPPSTDGLLLLLGRLSDLARITAVPDLEQADDFAQAD